MPLNADSFVEHSRHVGSHAKPDGESEHKCSHDQNLDETEIDHAREPHRSLAPTGRTRISLALSAWRVCAPEPISWASLGLREHGGGEAWKCSF
jgi:hypothetical protein